MVADHTVRMFRDRVSSATDAELRSFVSKHLPTIEEHLRMAKELRDSLGAGRPPAAPPANSGHETSSGKLPG